MSSKTIEIAKTSTRDFETMADFDLAKSTPEWSLIAKLGLRNSVIARLQDCETLWLRDWGDFETFVVCETK